MGNSQTRSDEDIRIENNAKKLMSLIENDLGELELVLKYYPGNAYASVYWYDTRVSGTTVYKLRVIINALLNNKDYYRVPFDNMSREMYIRLDGSEDPEVNKQIKKYIKKYILTRRNKADKDRLEDAIALSEVGQDLLAVPLHKRVWIHQIKGMPKREILGSTGPPERYDYATRVKNNLSRCLSNRKVTGILHTYDIVLFNKLLGKGVSGQIYLTCLVEGEEDINPNQCKEVIKIESIDRSKLGPRYLANDAARTKLMKSWKEGVERESNIQRIVSDMRWIDNNGTAHMLAQEVIPTTLKRSYDKTPEYHFVCEDGTIISRIILMGKVDSTLDNYIAKVKEEESSPDEESTRDARIIKYKKVAGYIILMLKGARANKVFHCDLKPDNIGFYHGYPLLIDFGNAGLNLTMDTYNPVTNSSWIRTEPTTEKILIYYDAICLHIYFTMLNEDDNNRFVEIMLSKLSRYLKRNGIYHSKEDVNLEYRDEDYPDNPLVYKYIIR